MDLPNNFPLRPHHFFNDWFPEILYIFATSYFYVRKKQFFQKKKKRIFNSWLPINDPLQASNQRQTRWSNDRWSSLFPERKRITRKRFLSNSHTSPSLRETRTGKYLSRVTRVNRADTFVRINSSCLRERGRRGNAESGREASMVGAGRSFEA